MKNHKYLFLICLMIFTSLGSDELIIDEKVIADNILEQIKSAKTSVEISADIISDEKTAEALTLSSKNGASVSIIIDSKSIEKSYSLHTFISSSPCSVFLYSNKKMNLASPFIIIDDRIVLYGSFSFQPGKYRNKEYMLLSEDKILIKDFRKYFSSLLNSASLYQCIKDTLQYDEIENRLKDYVNREIIVKGTAYSVSKSKKSDTYFIKLSKDGKGMTIVIFSNVAAELKNKNINPLYFKNKEIITKGLLINHEKYGYEIILSGSEFISF